MDVAVGPVSSGGARNSTALRLVAAMFFSEHPHCQPCRPVHPSGHSPSCPARPSSTRRLITFDLYREFLSSTIVPAPPHLYHKTIANAHLHKGVISTGMIGYCRVLYDLRPIFRPFISAAFCAMAIIIFRNKFLLVLDDNCCSTAAVY